MTVAIITLAGALAIICTAAGVLVWLLRDSFLSERASFAAEVMATREQIAAEVERDAFKAKALKATTEAELATKTAEAAQRAANRAREELVTRVSKEVLSASPADVLRIVDDLLSSPLPGVSADSPAPPAG